MSKLTDESCTQVPLLFEHQMSQCKYCKAEIARQTLGQEQVRLTTEKKTWEQQQGAIQPRNRNQGSSGEDGKCTGQVGKAKKKKEKKRKDARGGQEGSVVEEWRRT